jgi:hypothetical protein
MRKPMFLCAYVVKRLRSNRLYFQVNEKTMFSYLFPILT